MYYNLENIKDIDFQGIDTKNVKLIKYNPQSILFRNFYSAILVRPPSTFGYDNFDIEKKRRVNAIQFARQFLPDYVQETCCFDLEGNYIVEGNSTKIKLIARKVMWLDDVRKVKDLSFNQVFVDRALCRALTRISLFAIFAVIVTGRLYDIFCIFEDYNNPDREKNFMNLLSSNIMFGINPDTKQRVIFIDGDWDIKISDRKYTGYPLYQYFRRFFQGIIILSIMAIVFWIGLMFSLIYKKAQDEHITYN